MTRVCVCVRTCVLIVVLLLWPGATLAQEASGSRVLVMPFAARVEPGAQGGAGTALWLGEAAAILLGEGLQSRGLDALTRDQRLAAFDRLQLPMSSALTRATMIRVGELVGASEVVFGEAVLGSRLNVRVRTIDLASGRELQASAESAPLADMFQLFARLADRTAVTAGRGVPGRAAVVAALPLETFENYMKGLVAPSPSAQQRFLESALLEAPMDPRILIAAWNVYHAQGLHDKALAVANSVAAGSPLYLAARFAVARSLIELRRFDGAYRELTALYGRNPSGVVSNALGVVEMRRGTVAGATPATAYFARASKEEPDNTDYLFNLGYAHAVKGSAADALTWLRETVRFDAADADAHLVMSAVLTSAGRVTEAQRERDLARLLGAEVPAGTAVPTNLERLPDSLDTPVSPALAAAIANPAQRDQRETAAFHVDRARQLIARGAEREATNELRRAIYLAPYEDQPHLMLGRLYRTGGRLSDAIDEFRVAIWCRETLEGRLALGSALLEHGDKDLARAEADRALSLDPNSAEARDLSQRIGK